MSSNKAGRYSMLTTPVPGTTGTGLDQLVDAVFADTGLAGTNMAPDLLGGAGAANGLNQIILEAAAATGAAARQHLHGDRSHRDERLDPRAPTHGMDGSARRRRGRPKRRDFT
jgi:hypothetical protein